MPIGFDCGTYNLVSCQRDAEGNFVFKRDINAFISMPLEDRYAFNMMKDNGVSLVERKEKNIGYALGEPAVKMAYAMNTKELKRPMKDGCLNPQEKDAQQIMSIIIHSLIDDVKTDGDVLYYSVPANAINEETDADYHSKVLESIFKAYVDDKGFKVTPYPINEGLALVFAELGDKSCTGTGISFGAGQVNVCFAVYGAPVFKFSIVNSGDWIDKMAAKATGENPVFINSEKTKVDLSQEPATAIHRAIKAQYEIMIEKTVTEIKHGIEKVGGKARSDQPIDFVISGGTSSPPGFDKLFEKSLKQANLTLDVGSVIRPAEPLYSVAKGCLKAAEAYS